MSIRLEMLQVARLAPKVLGESADLVRGFFRRQLHEAGGFVDRTGRPDLYYTVFGLDGWLALHVPTPGAGDAGGLPTGEAVCGYVERFGTGEGLDFVHLCCLARARATLAQLGLGEVPGDWSAATAQRLAAFRAGDGGFHPAPGQPSSTVYAAFLALAAYQDLKVPLAEPAALARSVESLVVADGAWANERGIPVGATNATAAAVTVLRNLGRPVSAGAGAWLLARRHAQGGFVAVPGAPIPDLLSTATALHALSGLQQALGPVQDSCLDFIDTLWTNEGAFHGHWDDSHLDVEYAYYGLLALGHLSGT